MHSCFCVVSIDKPRNHFFVTQNCYLPICSVRSMLRWWGFSTYKKGVYVDFRHGVRAWCQWMCARFCRNSRAKLNPPYPYSLERAPPILDVGIGWVGYIPMPPSPSLLPLPFPSLLQFGECHMSQNLLGRHRWMGRLAGRITTSGQDDLRSLILGYFWWHKRVAIPISHLFR